jgi:hypothetical protein
MMRWALAAVAVIGCGGGKPPAPVEPMGNTPADPGPQTPERVGCHWAGRLTATISPMHGDATCIPGIPIEVELQPTRFSVSEFGDMEMDPSVATGENTGELNVSVTGGIDQCDGQLAIGYFNYPMHDRSLFVSIAAVQTSTGEITGHGTAQLSCNDGHCDCRADLTFAGSIE